MNDTLYIIGNGFDLHHGLNTSYTDFRDNYAKKRSKVWKILNKLYGKKLNEDMWWWNFEEMLGSVDYDSLLNQYNGAVLASITVKDFLQSNLPFFFGNWIQQLKLNVHPDTSLDINVEAQFFTFNYTMVLERIYNINKCNVWHIHNSTEDFRGRVNPIVGHDSDFGLISAELEKQHHKHPNIRMDIASMVNQEILNGSKKVEERISKNNDKFRNQYSSIQHYIFMGFSFNHIDMPYIKKILSVNNNRSDADWKIYWHSDGEDCHYRDIVTKLGVNKNNIELVKW